MSFYSHVVTLNVPSDKRGKFVKDVINKLFENKTESIDTQDNMVFELTPREYELLIRTSGFSYQRTEMQEFNTHINHLMAGDIVYGQLFFSTKELEEWNFKMKDAY